MNAPDAADDPTVATRSYDVPPGHYDVTVTCAASADGPDCDVRVFAEAHRLMVNEIRVRPGDRVLRSFSVNVRHPEGQQNGHGGPGRSGLDLRFEGSQLPRIDVTVTENRRPELRLFLVGDSTVTDQDDPPYTGWGQRIPCRFGPGLSVVNHSGSGESTVSMLDQPAMWPALVPQLMPGDVVLIQLAHNDKQTSAQLYRRNLMTMIGDVGAAGAVPVLVTPIVRLQFEQDRLGPTGLLVNGLGVDHPGEIRRLAGEQGVALIDLTAMSQRVVEERGPLGARSIYLVQEKDDRTHTSAYGADLYAGLVADRLHQLGLVPPRFWL